MELPPRACQKAAWCDLPLTPVFAHLFLNTLVHSRTKARQRAAGKCKIQRTTCDPCGRRCYRDFIDHPTSIQPPWSTATSTRTEPDFIVLRWCLWTKRGARAPGIKTAPMTCTAAVVRAREAVFLYLYLSTCSCREGGEFQVPTCKWANGRLSGSWKHAKRSGQPGRASCRQSKTFAPGPKEARALRWSMVKRSAL